MLPGIILAITLVTTQNSPIVPLKIGVFLREHILLLICERDLDIQGLHIRESNDSAGA